MALGAGRPLSAEEVARGFELLANPNEWRKEARRTYRRVGTQAARWAREEMRSSGDRQLAGAARGVRGNATPTEASVGVQRSSKVPYALAATWGTKGHTGWYAARRYDGGPPNNPPWIGNTWPIAVRGQGPRGLNDALATHLDDLGALFALEVSGLAARAFRPSALPKEIPVG